MDRSSLVDMGSFMDNLKAVKDDNLRSVMNASSIVGNAPKQVIAPKDRNPQTIDELRQERMDVMIQGEKQREAYGKLKEKWDMQKLLVVGVGIFLIGKVI